MITKRRCPRRDLFRAGRWRDAALRAMCLLFLAATAHAARAPMTDSDVPLFPGAEPDEAVVAAMGAEPYEGRDDASGVARLRSDLRRGYGTTAAPEEVFEYYRKKLAAVERQDDEYQALSPGSASKVTYDIEFHAIDGDPYFGCHYNCEEYARETKARWKKMKDLLAAHRKPYAPERWLSRAFLSWGVKESNGDDTFFEVSIADFSVSDDPDNPSYSPKTSIYVRRETQKSQEAYEEEVHDEGWRRHEAEHEDRRKALAAGGVFRPEDLGVPSYPGARHEADATRFLRESLAEDGVAYVTSDDVAKVAEFYKTRGGLELVSLTNEGAFLNRCAKEYNRFLKQTISTGECDLHVTVQNPWLAAIGGKKNASTLITFVKGEPGGIADPQAGEDLPEEFR